uniref:LOW QUALITY PROTEIN: uncharacterized protein LOC111110499 n=1 Tax=Crassostrea virginica TaxID=6565 RepID=A0A8B8BH88_CRAVI|nr:LOW QUALITY PROTEIN: uncharacterized protein LOC111110499 [Crassostrea virginica]
MVKSRTDSRLSTLQRTSRVKPELQYEHFPSYPCSIFLIFSGIYGRFLYRFDANAVGSFHGDKQYTNGQLLLFVGNETSAFVRTLKRKYAVRLVVAYMRGGSTLTADLVRHTERDFYVYEPLHGISQAVKRNDSIQFLNGTKRYISDGELDLVYTEMIYNWFTCNFQKIDIPGLTNPFIEIHTPEHRSYYSCIQPKNNSKTLIQRVEQCIPLLQVKCLNYKSRTIKTIRLPVEMAGKLLKWLPGMKFLYLIRDPRGIVNSQVEQVTEGKNVSSCAKELCQTISRDVKAFDELARCHRSRMLSVIYENLCQNPIAMVHKIYNFFGNKYSKRVKDFVKRMMQGPVRACDYCTDRGNALANAYRWISVIPKEGLHTIDSHCSFLYPYLGYKI